MNLLRKLALTLLLASTVQGLATAQAQFVGPGSSGTVTPYTASKASVVPTFAYTTFVTGQVGWVVMTMDIPFGPHLQNYSNTGLMVRYLDTGSSSDYVEVRLKEFNPAAGTSTTKMTFHSNSYTGSNSVQDRLITSSVDFDPYFAYYLEITLYRASSNIQPVFYGVRVFRF